ncbi:MAG: outer membrane lipoprotein carrier protein LolA [Candidatus Polarisedimenticolia bacterium]|nr:outer membrane lipoprotein carrier protein LolA [bacterium]
MQQAEMTSGAPDACRNFGPSRNAGADAASSPRGARRGHARRRVARIVVAALTLGVAVAAALAAAPGPDEALRLVERRYRALSSFKLSFAQRYSSTTFGAEDEARGTLTVAPPGRMLWVYDKPAGQRGAMDGTRYWLIDPEDRQVKIRERGPEASDPLSDLLAGRVDLARIFAAKLVASSRGRLALELTPRSPREDMDRALLEVDPDGTVRRIEVVDPLGNKMVYELGVPAPAPPPSAEAFRLVVPPGYAEIHE